MKLLLAALLAAISIRAQASSPLFDGGGPSALAPSDTVSTVTITGTGSQCFSAGGLVIDCNLNQEYIGTGATKSTFTNTGSLYMAAGSTLATSGGVLYISTDSLTSATVSHALQINPNGGFLVNGSGLDVIAISTNFVTNIVIKESDFGIARTTTAATGEVTQFFHIPMAQSGVTSFGSIHGRSFGKGVTQSVEQAYSDFVYLSSMSVVMPQPFSAAPLVNTAWEQHRVFVSTGLGIISLYTENLQNDKGATGCTPGSACVMPTYRAWSTNNQAGVTTQAMVLDSTGTLNLGATRGTQSDSSVRFYMNASSATIEGQLNIGYEVIVNACGAGVTTCTASCSANKVITGGACVSTVGLTGDGGGTTFWTCTSAIGTITATAYCARLGN